MGVGYAIGFSICGLQFGLALGLLFGMLNVVPFLGSVVGVVTTLLVAYLQPAGILESGEMTVLYGCGATFLIVQLLESYWLSPKVMGERTGLHPVAIIASVFFWGIVFGGSARYDPWYSPNRISDYFLEIDEEKISHWLDIFCYRNQVFRICFRAFVSNIAL